MAMGEDNLILKRELTPGSYCHEEFRAIRPSTLDTDHPTLKSPQNGDVIDYYGSCNESPVGQDQVLEQKMDNRRAAARDPD